MKLRIQHVTRYTYARPVVFQPHRLLLVPRGGQDLTVLASSIICRPEAKLDWSQDVFGNLIAEASFAEATDTLTIAGDVTVDQAAATWPVFRIAPDAQNWPFAYSETDGIDLGALTKPGYADGDGVVERWARALVLGDRTDTLSLLKDINAAILSIVNYRVRDEEGTQSPAQTLDMGSGSCRDIAALFIDAVRTLGFGARAVSGYLDAANAPPNEAGSTHAWAEVYLPSAGWIAFDPTNRRLGSAGLVPVAVARSNGQIMPVTGGYLGAPTDFVGMEVTVSVSPA